MDTKLLFLLCQVLCLMHCYLAGFYVLLSGYLLKCSSSQVLVDFLNVVVHSASYTFPKGHVFSWLICYVIVLASSIDYSFGSSLFPLCVDLFALLCQTLCFLEYLLILPSGLALVFFFVQWSVCFLVISLVFLLWLVHLLSLYSNFIIHSINKLLF